MSAGCFKGKISRGRALLLCLLLVNLAAVCIACDQGPRPGPSSLDGILEKGHIVMITQNSQNTYYIYREQPFGFEYELASAFADYLGVELAVVSPGWMEMFTMLEEGRGDFIAAGVTIEPSVERRVDFSEPYMTVRQVVIVNQDNYLIDSIEDLEGETVHVGAGTSYQERLAELLGKGIDMEVVLLPGVTAEELIEDVADSRIAITVADSNIARLNSFYLPEIRIAFPISPPKSIGWAVRKGDEELLETVNAFLTKIRIDGTLDEIYGHHYGNRNNLKSGDLRAFHRLIDIRMPRYRPLIKNTAREHGFDWRLIVAMIYQESHFDPDARSFTGVRGLMQVTQRTAEEMGIDDRTDPEQSIRAGVRYLANLYRRFEDVKNEKDRLLLALASYNVGYGHVRDAQKILRQRELDTDSWLALREALPLLRLPEYYRDTEFGYARGTEPVRYVENVMTYYDILKRKI